MTTWNNSPMFPGATINVVNNGDSISLTAGALRIYLPRLVALIEANQPSEIVSWTRCGINGASYNYAWSDAGYPYTMMQDAPRRVDVARSSLIPSWLIVFAGTNGIAIGSHSAATEYADFKTYIAARIAAGHTASRIVVCTMLPRTGLNETTRGTFNASVVADNGGYGYLKARLDLNANIGAAGQNLDATYFLDGTHPTDAGHAIIAQIIYDVMFP